MEEIRACWEVPSVAHFVATFQKTFGLPDFHVEELENALLTSCTQEGSDLLNYLLSGLLAGYYNSKNIESYNYESSLRDLLHQKWVIEQNQTNPLMDTEFRHLDMTTKIKLLYALCEYRLDAEDAAEQTKGINGEDMRIEPVGKDSSGATYWNFNNERLYKETETVTHSEKHKKKKKHKEKHKKKKGKHHKDSDDEESVATKSWSLVCSTVDEWTEVLAMLKKTGHKDDKKLRKILSNDFMPLIEELIAEKEKAIKKRLLECLPKRESSRIASRKQQVDEQKAMEAMLEAEEKAERDRIEAEKKKLAEERRREEIAREREERLRAREQERLQKEQAQKDRAMRAMMREQRVAMAGEGSDFLADTDSGSQSSQESDWENYNNVRIKPSSTRSAPSRRSRPASQNHTGSHCFGPREYEKLNKLLYQIQRNPNAWPFTEPVTREIAPDYFDIISQPMDISVIRAKAGRKEYKNKTQFMDDFNLIVENCVKYNGPTSEFGVMAQRLADSFYRLVERAFPTVSRQQRIQRTGGVSRSGTDGSSQHDSSQASDSSTDSTSDSGEETDTSYVEPRRTTQRQKINSHKREAKLPEKVIPMVRPSDRLASLSHHSSDDSSDMYGNNTEGARPVFGIARRVSHSQSSNTNTDSATHSFGKQNGDLQSSPNTLKSPSVVAKAVRTNDLARWMPGKVSHTNAEALRNGQTTAHIDKLTSPPINPGTEPFQGLFAQLKRTNNECSSGEPLPKKLSS